MRARVLHRHLLGDNMATKRREYEPQMKAAIMAALLAGQGTAALAAEYKVPLGTIDAWRAHMKAAPPLASLASEKRKQIGDLLIDYLHANLSTLRKQQEVFSDPSWLTKQDAGELAVLHGVMTDKAIRLLEALGGTDNK